MTWPNCWTVRACARCAIGSGEGWGARGRGRGPRPPGTPPRPVVARRSSWTLALPSVVQEAGQRRGGDGGGLHGTDAGEIAAAPGLDGEGEGAGPGPGIAGGG